MVYNHWVLTPARERIYWHLWGSTHIWTVSSRFFCSRVGRMSSDLISVLFFEVSGYWVQCMIRCCTSRYSRLVNHVFSEAITVKKPECPLEGNCLQPTNFKERCRNHLTSLKLWLVEILLRTTTDLLPGVSERLLFGLLRIFHRFELPSSRVSWFFLLNQVQKSR